MDLWLSQMGESLLSMHGALGSSMNSIKVAHTSNPALQMEKQEGQQFKVSSKLGWATWDPVPLSKERGEGGRI